jgi:hypothetical protein
MPDIGCSCGRKIPVFEPIWKCHDCKNVICGECLTAKTSNRMEFLCSRCTAERKGKIIKIRTKPIGDPTNGFKAWAILDKSDNLMMFEVRGKIMGGYNRHIDEIVKMADIIIQDRMVLLSGFHIGRIYIGPDTDLPPLKVRANETNVEILKA